MASHDWQVAPCFGRSYDSTAALASTLGAGAPRMEGTRASILRRKKVAKTITHSGRGRRGTWTLVFGLPGVGTPASLSSLSVRVLAAAAAVPIVARRIVSRPARARALARLAVAPLPAAPPPGVAPLPAESGAGVPPRLPLSLSSRPSPAHVVISHRRHAATPRVAAAASTPTRVAVVTAHHVIVAHPNLAAVSLAPRRLPYASPRASNL